MCVYSGAVFKYLILKPGGGGGGGGGGGVHLR